MVQIFGLFLKNHRNLFTISFYFLKCDYQKTRNYTSGSYCIFTGHCYFKSLTRSVRRCRSFLRHYQIHFQDYCHCHVSFPKDLREFTVPRTPSQENMLKHTHTPSPAERVRSIAPFSCLHTDLASVSKCRSRNKQTKLRISCEKASSQLLWRQEFNSSFLIGKTI